MNHSMLGLPVYHKLLKSIQTHVHRVSDAIQPSHPLLSPSPPAPNLSQHQGLFEWVRSSHWWPKYWSFSSNICPSNEHLGLISFRMDWLDLLAVLGTLKSLLQQHSSKASILQHSAFFIVQHISTCILGIFVWMSQRFSRTLAEEWTQINRVVWSLTWSQTLWNEKSSGL